MHPRERIIHVRAYLGSVRDAGRAFRVPADADLAATMKRAALAALPKGEGWRLLVFSFERTSEEEALAPFLDRLARNHMEGDAFVAALVATADGARAVLAVGARDPGRLDSVRTALGGKKL